MTDTSSRHSADLNVEALTRLFSERWRPDAEVTSCSRGPVGNGQEVWFVDVDSADESFEFVVRRTAESGPLDWTDREREYQVLCALEASGLPTARVLFFEPQGGLLERATFAMTRLPGSPLRRDPQPVLDAVVADLGRLLARLHAIDPAIVGEPLPRSGAEATGRELVRWEGRYHDKRRGSIPMLGALLSWLTANMPPRTVDAVLLWGDAGPYNTLHVDGQVTAMLDWELWHLGDPLEDLGGALWSVDGLADEEILLSAYEEELGVSIDREALAWYRVFAAVSRAVMLVNGVANVLDGASLATTHAGLGLHLLPATLRQAAEVAGWGSGGYSPESAAVVEPGWVGDISRPRPDASEILALVSAFLSHDVLPATEAPVLRRRIKTAAALVETAALRSIVEGSVSASRMEATDRLLAQLTSSDIDVSGGLETTARRIEEDQDLSDWRPAMRAHLLADLGRQEELLRPLDELYG